MLSYINRKKYLQYLNQAFYVKNSTIESHFEFYPSLQPL